jgi:hypothetical protein
MRMRYRLFQEYGPVVLRECPSSIATKPPIPVSSVSAVRGRWAVKVMMLLIPGLGDVCFPESSHSVRGLVNGG